MEEKDENQENNVGKKKPEEKKKTLPKKVPRMLKAIVTNCFFNKEVPKDALTAGRS